jgi:hypothetical protein
MVLPLAFAGGVARAAIPAHPGMLNYVEGQARINGQDVSARNVGTSDVAVGQVIETGAGKAEILLTPGVFLRLGDNSAVRMDAASLIDTRVALLSGHALIEADNLQKGNNIQILDNGAVSRLEKNGIYSFKTNPAQVETFDGKMQVTENDHSVDLGKGHAALLQASLQTTKFDRTAAENDSLYQWSKLRSQYAAEANVHEAGYLVANSAYWYGPGWYWDPWFGMYSWIPGGGFFGGPFGWGFYSPFVVWQSPLFYHYYPYGGVYRGAVAGRYYARPALGGVRPMASGFAHTGEFGHVGGFAHAGGGRR